MAVPPWIPSPWTSSRPLSSQVDHLARNESIYVKAGRTLHGQVGLVATVHHHVHHPPDVDDAGPKRIIVTAKTGLEEGRAQGTGPAPYETRSRACESRCERMVGEHCASISRVGKESAGILRCPGLEPLLDVAATPSTSFFWIPLARSLPLTVCCHRRPMPPLPQGPPVPSSPLVPPPLRSRDWICAPSKQRRR